MRTWALAWLAAAVFLAGAIHLFNRQFASGEAYPEFSSLRTDPMGAKLLYDSLASLPGVTVERNFLPLEFAPRDGVALVFLGVNPLAVNWNEELLLRAAGEIAGRGNRVVLAMRLDPEARNWKQEEFERGGQPQSRDSSRKASPADPPLKSMWKVSLKLDSNLKGPHPLYFAQADGWEVRKRSEDKLVSIERRFGKGSVALSAESKAFTNESVAALDTLQEVAGEIGPYRRIIFDERHLGIAESGSIVGMARQFRMTGLAFGLALVAGLFIWRNAAAFPPAVARSAGNSLAGRTSHAGLLTLLKRHIAPAELAAVCWREWLSANGRSAPPEIRAKAEAILAGQSRRPVEAAREIQELLRAKGEL